MSSPTAQPSSGGYRDEELEVFVADFESDAAEHSVLLQQRHLPPAGHPRRLEIVTELVRADLDLSRLQGKARQLEDYRPLVPELFASRAHMEAVAFEEYRLRKDAGEVADPCEYQERFGLECRNWAAGEDLDQATGAGIRFPEVGDRFAGMPLVSLLGVGAFGRVYLARQSGFGDRFVALKVTLKTELDADRMGRLQHTNIVPVYSVHASGELQGVCMPYFGPRTLANTLDDGVRMRVDPEASTRKARLGETIGRSGGQPLQLEPFPPPGPAGARLPWRHAVELVAQLAEGLDHAHKRGVVHSDIKPANILLGDDGVPRLLDFNLAAVDQAAAQYGERIGGSLPYMSPEHLGSMLNGRPVEPPSDVFSLGVVLFELLTASKPYPERQGGLAEICQQMIQDRVAPPAPRDRDASLPPGVDTIVRGCLAADPRQRPTAAHLAEDLRRELNDQPLRWTREGWTLGRTAKWFRRKRSALLKLSTAAVLLALIAASLVAWRREVRAEDQRVVGGFRRSLLDARVSLAICHADEQLLDDGVRHATAALDAYQVMDDPRWWERGQYLRLPHESQQEVVAGVAELAEMLKHAAKKPAGYPSDGELPTPFETNVSPAVRAAQLISQGDPSKAITLIEPEVAKQASPDAVAWTLLGVAQSASGEVEQGLRCLTAAVALMPGSHIPLRVRGMVNLDAGRPTEALQDFREVASLAGDQPSNHLNMALALFALGRLKEADSEITQAIQQRVDRPRAWLLRAKIRSALGDPRGAGEDRDAAAKSGPRDDLDFAALASAFLPTPEAAVRYIDRGLERFPASVPLLRVQIHLLGDKLGAYDQAFEAANKLLAIRPNDIQAGLSRAVLLVKLGEPERAVEAVRAMDSKRFRPIDLLQSVCVLAASTDESSRREAAARLQGSLVAEPKLAALAVSDPDLAPLRADPVCQGWIAAAESLLRRGDTAKPPAPE